MRKMKYDLRINNKKVDLRKSFLQQLTILQLRGFIFLNKKYENLQLRHFSLCFYTFQSGKHWFHAPNVATLPGKLYKRISSFSLFL